MQIRLLTEVKIGTRVRPAGMVIDVDAELRAELVSREEAEDVKAPLKKKKKNVKQLNTEQNGNAFNS